MTPSNIKSQNQEESKIKDGRMQCFKLKEGEAKVLLKNTPNIHLTDDSKMFFGKKIYSWSFPYELIDLSKKLNKRLIGLNKWLGTNRRFFCIVYKDEIIYLDVSALYRLLDTINEKCFCNDEGIFRPICSECKKREKT